MTIYVRTVPRRVPLPAPWNSDTITIQVDSEAAAADLARAFGFGPVGGAR